MAMPPNRPTFQRRFSVMRKEKMMRVMYCTSAPNRKAMGTLRKMPSITSKAFDVFR